MSKILLMLIVLCTAVLAGGVGVVIGIKSEDLDAVVGESACTELIKERSELEEERKKLQKNLISEYVEVEGTNIVDAKLGYSVNTILIKGESITDSKEFTASVVEIRFGQEK